MVKIFNDLVKFWQISDNVPERVQDRHSYNERLIRNHMWPIE